MPDVFVSYSAKDSQLAKQLEAFLRQNNLEVFLAELSIQPGARWKDSIIQAMNESRWIFFLATPESCKSTPVMHELGGALFLKKNLVSLLWQVTPRDLPDWVQDRHAIRLEEKQKIVTYVQRVAATVKSDKFIAGLVAGGLICFVAWLFLKKK